LHAYTHELFIQTNIVIDDNLIKKAIERSRFSTKKAVVEEALKLFVQTKNQASLKEFR
jgi:Arc/MetJ family transcription regulator